MAGHEPITEFTPVNRADPCPTTSAGTTNGYKFTVSSPVHLDTKKVGQLNVAHLLRFFDSGFGSHFYDALK